MSERTFQVLDGLDSVAAAVLLALCRGPACEHEVAQRLAAVSQPTVNRRLHALARAGLVTRDQGTPHAPGRRWRLILPTHTAALLHSAINLGEAVAAHDAQRRADARRTLGVRAGRLRAVQQ